MSAGGHDYYTVLGVLREASQEEIKRAYFEAAQRLHPDKNVAAGETELFLEIQQAYEVLSNPKRRAQYDATLAPEIEGHPLLKHQVLFSRPKLVELDEPQLIYALLELGPYEDAEKIAAPPLNVCLLLDRSTSMRGEKMDMVKAAAIQFLRSLRTQDIFSIIAFSDRPEVVIPAGDLSGRAKQEARVQMLQTTGGTEMLQGLQAALQEVRRTTDPQRVHHIILLTDGHTYGDEQGCLQLAEEAASANIGITGMGIGNEWNDIFLDSLTSRTGGTSAYIAKPKDIQRLLIDKFKALASVYAEEVVLEFKPQEQAQLNYVFRLQPEGGPVAMQSPWLLGPILQDAPLNVLFEVVVQPGPARGGKVTLLDGALKISMSSQSRPVAPIRLRLTRDVEADPDFDPPPTKILRALSHLALYRIQERAQAEVAAGNYENAARQLQNMATHLYSQGENELAKTALLEAEHLQQMHAWSDGGSKTVKYSTRALLLAGVRESIA